jgi:hypothetical protein
MAFDRIAANFWQRGAYAMSFDVKSCQVLYYGPHRAIAGRMTGVVRVKIREQFMGTVTDYSLDLKVRAETGSIPSEQVKSALLTHAARQLNKIKDRHARLLIPANTMLPAIAAE